MILLYLSEDEINILLEALQVDRELHKDLIERLKKYAWKSKYHKITKKF